MRFDQDHQRLWHHSIEGHRLRGFLALHSFHHGVRVRNVHKNGHPSRILWIYKCSYVGHAEGTKKLLRFGKSSQCFAPFVMLWWPMTVGIASYLS